MSERSSRREAAADPLASRGRTRGVRSLLRNYEDRSRGLGSRLVDAADAALGEIATNSQRCHEIDPGYRQKLLRRFPFAFVYRIDPDEIVVVAFMHLRRRPGYWKDRLR